MFGHFKQKTAQTKEKSSQPKESKSEKIEKISQKNKEERQKSFKEGEKNALDTFEKDIPGLHPEKKKAMEYESEREIDRELENADRALLGDQSRRGIVGKGGVGYAQRADLKRIGLEEKGKAKRDLAKLDKDLSIKKAAAAFAGGQGEAALSNLDRQSALSELQLNKEKKHQRKKEKKFSHLFNRI